MARRWTLAEEQFYREQLIELYVRQNKTIAQIASEIGLGEGGVFGRLQRLGIPTCPERKLTYVRKAAPVALPGKRSEELAEFFGIMLGDGCLTPTQVSVTLGNKEPEYATYVTMLMRQLFASNVRIRVDNNGYRIVYFGSTTAVAWLRGEGLVHNKVAAQVGAPEWVYTNPRFMMRFLRGFFDTDGSIYRLRFGTQLSFTNKSAPLLLALQRMLKTLGYRVSEVSAFRIYITKRSDVMRFFREIQPKNKKHQDRFDKFCVGGRAVNCSRL